MKSRGIWTSGNRRLTLKPNSFPSKSLNDPNFDDAAKALSRQGAVLRHLFKCGHRPSITKIRRRIFSRSRIWKHLSTAMAQIKFLVSLMQGWAFYVVVRESLIGTVPKQRRLSPRTFLWSVVDENNPRRRRRVVVASISRQVFLRRMHFKRCRDRLERGESFHQAPRREIILQQIQRKV